CAVVKCNGYGHGQDLLLPLMTDLADWLGVATPAEAIALRESGVRLPILVFFSACGSDSASTLDATLDELLRRRVTLTIAAEHDVNVLDAACQRTDCDARVHVMVDTGMTRSGLLPTAAPALLQRLRATPAIRLTGVYTHLATADEADKTFAREQLQRFEDCLSACNVGPGILRHAANSAAIMDLPEAHYDMVRPGIALYGYPSSDELLSPLDLRPSLRLSAHVMQIKTVPAGTGVGYGQTFHFDRESRVGLVPIGYGDGYLRCLSNRASMRIGDRTVPVIGRVSMDQTCIDLTDLPDVRTGQAVEVISPDAAAPNSLQSLARQAETIPYELLCRLGDRVRRKLIDA
ncbi:MAG: alanine racemase, partial [Phycisphaerae bacterium]|nr:alanine racemase [Phycisphaerae bacterium]